MSNHITPGIYEGISNDQYHKDKTWLSSSQLKTAYYSAFSYKYFVRDGLGVKEESKSKSFGTAVHKYILEHSDFFNEFAVLPDIKLDLRKTADRERKAEFEKEHTGKTILTYDEFTKVQTCRDSVLSHKDARKLLEAQGLVEASCYVILDVTLPDGEIVPFRLRFRPDKVCNGLHMIDLKTTKSPAKDAFIRDAFGMYGYHYDLSAALYLMGWEKLTGEVLPYYWIAVRNDQPWETAVYRMKTDTFWSGQKKLKQALTTIIMAERSGVWEYQSQVEEI